MARSDVRTWRRLVALFEQGHYFRLFLCKVDKFSGFLSRGIVSRHLFNI